MMRARQRGTKRRAPQGIGLAFVALAIQILLPFLVAYEITLASTPAHAESTAVICSTAPALPQPGHAAHHGMADHPCPLCVACAASQAFTAAPPVALPLPRGAAIVIRAAAPEPGAVRSFAASYQSRAPPIG